MAHLEDLDDLDPAAEMDLNAHIGGDRGPSNRASGRGRGGRGGRGGGRGGGGGDRDMLISKALSKLLRHAADEAGLKLDDEGFAGLDEVLKWPRIRSLNVTLAEIQSVVNTNAKQRFTLKPKPSPTSSILDPNNPSTYLIRANQGHSIALSSSSLLEPLTLESPNLPKEVVHGTYFAFYPAILESGGLRKMGRNHIHFAPGLPSQSHNPQKEGEANPEVISGMRTDADLLIYIDLPKSIQGGIQWWLSSNGVILTEGDEDGLLSTKYFERVVGKREDIGVLWKDGVEVASLPVKFRGARAPRGKGVGGGSGRGGGRRGGGGMGNGDGGGKGGGRGGRGGRVGKSMARAAELGFGSGASNAMSANTEKGAGREAGESVEGVGGEASLS